MSSSPFLYEPFYDLDRILREGFFRKDQGAFSPQRALERADSNSGIVRTLKPNMDLHENLTSNSVTATFELPGLKKEDIDIHIHNGQLTVSGQSATSTQNDQNGYIVRERRFGKFARTLQLPQGVKDEDVQASMENGVLIVTFPKRTPEMTPRKISVA